MPHIPLEVLSRGWLNIMRFITGSDSVSDNQLVRFNFDTSQLFATICSTKNYSQANCKQTVALCNEPEMSKRQKHESSTSTTSQLAHKGKSIAENDLKICTATPLQSNELFRSKDFHTHLGFMLTAAALGQKIAAIAPDYVPYVELFVLNGFDGTLLIDLSDEELPALIESLGISNALHRRRILAELKITRLELKEEISSRCRKIVGQ